MINKSKGVSKIVVTLGVLGIILLGGILYNSYLTSTSNDRYYEKVFAETSEYVQKEDWDMVLYEMNKLNGLVPRDKKLMEKRDLFISSAKVHKALKGN